MMGEPVEERCCHLGIRKDARPFAAGQVGSNDNRGALVELADGVEQKQAPGLGKGQIAQFTQDQKVESRDRTALAAQAYSIAIVDHLSVKTKMLDRLRSRLNWRQEKAQIRMFDAGPDGFGGELSATNYMSIIGTAPATARRDLGDLVAKAALTRTGDWRWTRNWLSLVDWSTSRRKHPHMRVAMCSREVVGPRCIHVVMGNEIRQPASLKGALQSNKSAGWLSEIRSKMLGRVTGCPIGIGAASVADFILSLVQNLTCRQELFCNCHILHLPSIVSETV